MLVRLYLYKQTLRFEVGNHLFSCFVAVHACVLAAYVGADSRVVVHHGDNRQVVALTYHEVVGVVRRGDLNNAGTELHVNIVVGDYRYLAVGAFLSGVMFHWIFKGKPLALRLPMAYVGELFGTSVIGGMLSFPIAYLIMNNTAATLFGFVFPFFASSVVGTVIAAIVVTSLKRVKAIDAFFGDVQPQKS